MTPFPNIEVLIYFAALTAAAIFLHTHQEHDL